MEKIQIKLNELSKANMSMTRLEDTLQNLQRRPPYSHCFGTANAPTISYEHINRISNLLKFPCKPNSAAPLINDNLNPKIGAKNAQRVIMASLVVRITIY